MLPTPPEAGQPERPGVSGGGSLHELFGRCAARVSWIPGVIAHKGHSVCPMMHIVASVGVNLAGWLDRIAASWYIGKSLGP
jgi:hypothetical protein